MKDGEGKEKEVTGMLCETEMRGGSAETERERERVIKRQEEQKGTERIRSLLLFYSCER